MIRIDEIYYNTFLPLIQSKSNQCAHFFDPFGTTDFENLCQVPYTENTEKNFLFWDQEPLHLDVHCKTIEKFSEVFKSNHTVLVTSEHNSEAVKSLCKRFGFSEAYYFFHGWASLDWYRGYNRTFLRPANNIKHTFLFPNNIVGGKRRHRLELFSELEKRNLISDNLISFPKVCSYEKKSVAELASEYGFDPITTELPLKIDNIENYAYNSHQINMWDLASQSLVHVVSETVFYGKRQHLTEKTFKPIVMQQPFILASCQRSLEYLRKYGFETFSSVWDESYDTLPDDQRIKAIGLLLEDLEHSNCREWLSEQCAPIVEHNFNHFYGGGFERVLWKELTSMVETW